MSILLKDEISDNHKNGNIHIQPYNPDQLEPNSYDVRLSNILKVYDNFPLDVKKNNKCNSFIIPEEGFVLQPGILYLGSTVESIGSDYYVPMYEGKSSIARLGIQSHISAGFGDIGFKQKWTLEIIVVHKVKIYPNMKIGQICFHNINEKYNREENRYNGKYTDQQGPQPSKSYLDN